MSKRGAKSSGGGPKGPVKTYLIAYNALSALAWTFVLASLLKHVTHFGTIDKLATLFSYPRGWSLFKSRAETTFLEIGTLTKWVQTAAVLEILHALLGFVRSSVPTTAAQVASRLFLVWVICYRYPAVAGSTAYTTMVLAWSVTEVIRYSHYVLTLLGTKVDLLEWLRYSTFYVLYPLGAGSEAVLVFLSAKYAKKDYGVAGQYALYGLTLLWPPALAVMMSHMHAQRRKHVRGIKSPAATVKDNVPSSSSAKKQVEHAADEAKSATKKIQKKTSTRQLREREAHAFDDSDLSDTPAKSTRSKKAVK